jgi:hypothetical protein
MEQIHKTGIDVNDPSLTEQDIVIKILKPWLEEIKQNEFNELFYQMSLDELGFNDFVGEDYVASPANVEKVLNALIKRFKTPIKY